jgi:hypothetical protein
MKLPLEVASRVPAVSKQFVVCAISWRVDRHAYTVCVFEDMGPDSTCLSPRLGPSLQPMLDELIGLPC